MNKDITDMKTDITTNTNVITVVKKDITDMKTDITTNNKVIIGVKKDITDMKTDITTNTNVITGVKKDITDMKTDITTNTGAITGVRRDITGIQTTLGKNAIALKGMQDDITPLKGYINTCAVQDWTTIKSQTITYDSLYLSSSNLGQLGEALNTRTGLFTAPVTGDYLVTYGLWAANDAGDSGVNIYIRKESVKIGESKHYSGSSGWVRDQ